MTSIIKLQPRGAAGLPSDCVITDPNGCDCPPNGSGNGGCNTGQGLPSNGTWNKILPCVNDYPEVDP